MYYKLFNIKKAVILLPLLFFACGYSNDLQSKLDTFNKKTTVSIIRTNIGTTFDNESVEITITSNKPDAVIKYTLYGADPTTSGTVYTGAFPLTAVDSYTLNAYAEYDGDASTTATLPVTVGDGTTYPYEIRTSEQLKNLSDLVISNNATYASLSYKQTADIDLSGYTTGTGWTPIGQDISLPFTGTYDGNGFTISGLVINNTSGTNLGLFGYVVSATSADGLKNIAITSANVTGGSYVAALTGWFENGEITSCRISNSAVSGTSNAGRIGGLVGRATSPNLISDCYVTDTTISGFGTYIGGMIGSCESAVKITKSHVDGSSTISNTSNCSYAGGFAGIIANSSDINTSSSNANINLTFAADYIGGFAGSISVSATSECYSSGNINASGITVNYAGGFVGQISVATSSTIYRSYSRGDINAIGDYHGGFVGSINDAGNTEIKNCYSTGNVTGSADIGGFTGYQDSTNLLYINCYWLQIGGGTNSGLTHVANIVSGPSAFGDDTTINNKDDATMQAGGFTGWDFPATWSTNASINDGYPYLVNNTP